ncbi:E3 ubiquitin-protein ligase SDIR1 [Glycine max]|nr:E3 ubiquitin-protein ligase SDIR1 [Glycine max]KAH1196699.1 E3 ubiquitin-protein ligase SDIR1 [Glycine max]
MSFVFRGTRADIENGFPGFIPERRALRVHATRPSNSNSLTFLVTGPIYALLLICFSSSVIHDTELSPDVPKLSGKLWLVLGVFLMATMLRMYATCQQLQAQAQAHAAAASGILGHTELRLHMPPSIALASRGRLQGLRLQLALLDREFDDLDYETLRALDSDNVSTAPSMTEEEINALPVHKYKVSGPQCGGSSMQQASSSAPAEKKQDNSNAVGSMKASDDDLSCSVCLEQVNVGDVLRSLPCLHQFHANCIDPWLRQQGTCPVCKFRAGSGWSDNGHNDIIADMV